MIAWNRVAAVLSTAALMATAGMIPTTNAAEAPASHPAASDAAIRGIVDGLTDAWNRGDAAGWAGRFADDVTFINIRGDVVHGRAAVEQIHAVIFNGPYHGSRLSTTVDSIGYPAPTVAVVETTMELAGYRGLPPGVAATAPGLLRTRMKLVVVDHGGGGRWQVYAAQNTAVAAQPLNLK